MTFTVTDLCLVFAEITHAGLAGRRDSALLVLFSECLLRGVSPHVIGDLFLVLFGPVQVHGRGVPVQGVSRIRIGQELRQEALEDVGQVVERRPGLVDHVQAHGAGHFVDVRMIHLKHQEKLYPVLNQRLDAKIAREKQFFPLSHHQRTFQTFSFHSLFAWKLLLYTVFTEGITIKK